MFSSEESKMAFYMLGRVELSKYLRLQRQLVETQSYASDRIQVLLCEHEPVISVGRMGSHADIRLGACLLYTSPSPRDATLSRMPSSA